MDRTFAIALIIAVGLVLPETAAAATRYANPGGLTSGTCVQGSECDLVTAINAATGGDTVIVNSGTYGSQAAPITTQLNPAGKSLTIKGAAGGAQRPVIWLKGSGSGYPVVDFKAAGAVADLTLHSVTGEPLQLQANATATRIMAIAESGAQGDACELVGSGAVLSDSVCWSSDVDQFSGVASRAQNTRVDHVTAIGHRYGLYLDTPKLTVVNSILMSVRTDADAGDIAGANTTTTLINDEYTRSVFQTGSAPNATATVSATPQFVDATHGDFHELPGAPSVGTGSYDASQDALTDLDVNPRTRGGKTDIGAFQDQLTPLATSTAASAILETKLTLNGSLDAAGLASSYHFIWGTAADALTNSTQPVDLAAASGPQAVSASLTDLTAGTQIFYALVATNSHGTATSSVMSATTNAPGTDPLPPDPTPTPTPTPVPTPAPVIVVPPVLCNGLQATLLDVSQHGSTVSITGIARSTFAGQTAVIKLKSKAVGSAQVAADGTFATTVKAPRAAKTAAYSATIGTATTKALKLQRSLIILKRSAGSITGRLTSTGKRRPKTLTVYRQATCTSRSVVGTAKLSRTGTFTAKLPTVPGQTTIYRLTAKVGGGKSYTLPIAIRG